MDKRDQLQLTVVMPNYNDGAFVAEALTAICEQIHGRGKILFIDDGSTDDSVTIAQRLLGGRDDAEVRVNPRNQGVISTLNTGLENVDTPYVYFAASNDRVAAGFFETGLDLFGRYPDAAICSFLVRYMTAEGMPCGMMRVPLPLLQPGFISKQEAEVYLRRYGQWIVGAGTIFNTAMLRRIGGFDPTLHGATDSVAAMMLALTHGACFVPRLGADWRRSKGGFALTSMQDWRSVEQTITQGVRHLQSACGTKMGYPRTWRREQLYWYFRSAANAGKTREALANIASIEPLTLLQRALLALPFPRLITRLHAAALAPFKFLQAARKQGQWLRWRFVSKRGSFRLHQ